MKTRLVVVGILAVLAVLASPVLATEIVTGEYPGPTFQNSPEPDGLTTPPAPNTYGTQNWVELNLSTSAFVPLSNAEWSCLDSGHCYRSAGANSGACADVTLPTGALVNGITVWLKDQSATGYMQVKFREMDWIADTTNQLFDYTTDAVGTPGWVKQFQLLTAGDHTVDNSRRGYRVCTFQWTTMGNSLGQYGVTIWYHLQISPAPAVATFPDVAPGHWAFQHIEALAAAGITTGFPDGTFKPLVPVTRAQMATFLARALGLNWSDF